MMGFVRGLLIALILGLVGRKLIRALWFLKPGMPIFPHSPGPCQSVTGAQEGSEDFAMLPNGQVLISSGLRFRTTKFADRTGKILLFDFKKPTAVQELKIIWKDDKSGLAREFNPHGIDVFSNKAGKTFVFVINHDPHEAVERFSLDLKKKTLTHLESITDANMHDMNSVVAVGVRSFFYSNLARFKSGIMAELEMFLEFSLGFVASFDGKTSTSTILRKGYHLPNGLAISQDKKKLYLSDIGNLAIDTFDIHSLDNITLSDTIALETAVDNIQVDPTDGSLWLGCQPSVWVSMQYLRQPDTMIAPAQVLRVGVAKDGNPSDSDVTEIYRNQGEEISTSTVAARYESSVLIGSLYHNMIHCQIKN